MMTPLIPERPGGTTVADRYHRAKAALVKADPFYESESFWKAFEEGGLDEFQVAKLEAMAKSCQDNDAKDQSPVSGADDSIGQLLDRYDIGEIETVQDLADEAEALAMKTNNGVLMDAVKGFQEWQKEDWELAGRGDSDAAEAALIAGIKRARSVK